MEGFAIRNGFDDAQCERAARLFWEAFSGKLGLLMGPAEKAVSFFKNTLDPDFAIAATGADGTLIGLAGYKTAQGQFAGGEWTDLTGTYGTLGALWRTPLLALVERPVQKGQLLMDGIFVSAQARGIGVGSALLDAIEAEAIRQNLTSIRLDVIDTNPRAQTLYERKGFQALEQHSTGPLRHIFGFRSSLTMEKKVSA